jgi:DNA-binding PadR family transcriptional regulator
MIYFATCGPTGHGGTASGADGVLTIPLFVIAKTGRLSVMPRRRREDPDADEFLPLPRDTFDVLVSLADRDRHGYAILQDIAERTGGRIRLSPSTLYAVIKRLLEAELIEELSERPDPAHDDERRRYYRLTPLGRRVAKSEAARLTRLLADARASGLVPRRR